jgi:hypothetical protein
MVHNFYDDAFIASNAAAAALMPHITGGIQILFRGNNLKVVAAAQCSINAE